jgi:tetratricopeptide (TPR) repeat protein
VSPDIKNPDHDFYILRAKMYLDDNDYEKALQHFQQALNFAQEVTEQVAAHEGFFLVGYHTADLDLVSRARPQIGTLGTCGQIVLLSKRAEFEQAYQIGVESLPELLDWYPIELYQKIKDEAMEVLYRAMLRHHDPRVIQIRHDPDTVYFLAKHYFAEHNWNAIERLEDPQISGNETNLNNYHLLKHISRMELGHQSEEELDFDACDELLVDIWDLFTRRRR